MSQFPLFSTSYWSVTDLTRYLRSIFVEDQILQDVRVQGELSNFARPSSGHLYFMIKDQSATLRCVMWKNFARSIKFSPMDGNQVEVHGYLDIYEINGQYQLYVDTINLAGEGVLFQQYIRLKEKLEQEGLFSPDRKRPLPRYPNKIGVVTSPTGAAFRDIINTIKRRYPLAEIILSPTAVQGVNAPTEIINALKRIEQYAKPDVILLVRGGGSLEDLAAFNDEALARTIAETRAPVITGIGHETDFSIADFVSDLRSPTPTASAELATPNREELITTLKEIQIKMNEGIKYCIANLDQLNRNTSRRLQYLSPLTNIRNKIQHMDEIKSKADYYWMNSLDRSKNKLSSAVRRLDSLNPMAVLERGYAVITNEQGKILTRITQFSLGENINLHLRDGEVSTNVNRIIPKK